MNAIRGLEPRSGQGWNVGRRSKRGMPKPRRSQSRNNEEEGEGKREKKEKKKKKRRKKKKEKRIGLLNRIYY